MGESRSDWDTSDRRSAPAALVAGGTGKSTARWPTFGRLSLFGRKSPTNEQLLSRLDLFGRGVPSEKVADGRP